MGEDRPRLSVSARYLLEILSRSPRTYSTKNLHVCAFARKRAQRLCRGSTPAQSLGHAGGRLPPPAYRR
jgi:hypothetical protein